VGEQQADSHGGDLDCAVLIPSVPAAARLVCDRDLPPRKGLELGEQVRLVAFDRDQVMRAAAVKVSGWSR
jgi:hypothetical protein